MVEGEMWTPYSAAPEQDHFQVVYSIAKCCFNGPPQVQHFVDCSAVKGATLEEFSGLVKVAGTLHIKVTRDENKVDHVYWMDVESVTPM